MTNPILNFEPQIYPLRLSVLNTAAPQGRLWIFNPDTDYALASGSKNYTPPRSIREIRARMALLPAVMAREGDSILVPEGYDVSRNDDGTRQYEFAIRKGVRLVKSTDITKAIKAGEWQDPQPTPWGWNHQIRNYLEQHVGLTRGLPGWDEIDAIRSLSHRRTTISMHRQLQSVVSEDIVMPREAFSVEETMEKVREFGIAYVKAPWSSSGRGVVSTTEVTESQLQEWVHGIIRRQGSVMVEKGYQRRLDFATEWYAEGNEIHFLGYSIFNVSNRGKYSSNLLVSQAQMLNMIREVCPEWDRFRLSALRQALQRTIGIRNSPESSHVLRYQGPLGVDMLVTSNGRLNPCVEINFRWTMGIAALFQSPINDNRNHSHEN